MRDVEFVLRIFALRHAQHYRGGMQSFLDQYMVRSRRFGSDDIELLRCLFLETIQLAEAIYGDHLFRPWNVKKSQWATQPQIAYADSIMVGLSSMLDKKNELLVARSDIVDATKQLVIEKSPGTFTGQRNTKDDVLQRISAYKSMLTMIVK